MSRSVTCTLCRNELNIKFNVTEYIQHVRLFHAYKPDFKITCGIQARTEGGFGRFGRTALSKKVHNLHSKGPQVTLKGPQCPPYYNTLYFI